MALAEGFFWGQDPNVNAKLRERIAMQLMGQRRTAPKNLGEGLSAIGDALGDLGMARRLESQDLAQQQTARDIAARVMGGDDPSATPAPAPSPAAAPPVVTPAAPPTSAIYSNDQPSPLDPPSGADRDAAIRTIVAEAGNQSPEGQAAVASVIRNRAVNGGFGGINAGGVVTSPNQFEPWNTPAGRTRMASIAPNSPAYGAAAGALDSAYAGNDPTNGATNFFAPKAQAALGRPAPAWGRGPGQDIGDHRFFGGAQQPAIQQAPRQPQQIAQAPQPTRTDADPGYVPPEPAAPQQPTKVPMSSAESRARLELMRNPNNEYVKQQMMPIIEREQQAREYEQSRQLEVWKQGLETQRQMTIEREKARMTEAQRRLEAQKLENEIAAGKAPTLKTIDGSEYVYDPVTKMFQPPKIAGASGTGDDRPRVKLNEGEGKSLKFGRIMMDAGRNIGDASALTNQTDSLKHNIPVAGNYLVSDKYREQYDHAMRWVMAKLRDESGATIGTTEFIRDMKAFFPQPGDTAKEIANKAHARKIAEQGMIDASGPGRKVFEHEERRRSASGGEANPIVVQSEAEANALPKGTYGVLNGRRFRVN